MEQLDIGWYDQQLVCRATKLRRVTERTMKTIDIPALIIPWRKAIDAFAARGHSARSVLQEEKLVWRTLSRLSGRKGIMHLGRAIPVDSALRDLLLDFCRGVIRFEKPTWQLEPACCPTCSTRRQVPRVLRLEWTRQHMEVHQQRVAGILIGLAAGDENGGPTEMALRLAESLLERKCYEPDEVFARYLDWHREGSYDTGPVTGRVLAHVLDGISRANAVEQTDIELKGMTAGCNAAHRAGVLAMAPWLSIDALVDAARTEAHLTHHHPIAADAAIAVAVQCRDQVIGRSRFKRGHLGRISTQLHPEIQQALRGPSPTQAQIVEPDSPARKQLHAGGYSPGTLHTALAFARTPRYPAASLLAAKDFAGPDNYCPVLVGAFLGARFGAGAFEGHLRHHPRAHVARINEAAWGLADLWRPNQGNWIAARTSGE